MAITQNVTFTVTGVQRTTILNTFNYISQAMLLSSGIPAQLSDTPKGLRAMLKQCESREKLHCKERNQRRKFCGCVCVIMGIVFRKTWSFSLALSKILIMCLQRSVKKNLSQHITKSDGTDHNCKARQQWLLEILFVCQGILSKCVQLLSKLCSPWSPESALSLQCVRL